jgi:hypothetical protein
MFGLLAQTTTTTTSAGLGAGGAALIAGGVLLYFAVIVVSIICMWKIFDKAGQKGWLAIIPILNWVTLLKVVHKEIWWIILLLIPCVNIFVIIIVIWNLAKAFGHGGGWGLGLIFLPFIFGPMLAFGSSRYAYDVDPLF